MATTSPKYAIGDVVYLRESAALGFLEAVKVNGIHLGRDSDGWLYTVNASLSPPSAGAYMDRRSHVSTQILYYGEDEFVTHCDALVLAEANARVAYEKLKAQRQVYCPDQPSTNPTAGTNLTG
jgi:hypothetical protein